MAPRTTLAGTTVHDNPVEGEIELVRETVPVNPLSGATVIVEVAAVPMLAETEVGLAATVKSVTVYVTVAV